VSVRLTLLLVSLLAWAPSVGSQPADAPQCTDWQACRDLAEQARAAGDYERFHDLAWRAVQTRGRRDPELFFLLARAQALSGRPDDALVTLQRLAQEMHVAKDVSQDEDFRRVRARPRWAEIGALIAEVALQVPPAGSAEGFRQKVLPEGSPEGVRPTARPNLPEEPSVGTNRRNLPSEPTSRAWEEVARFPAHAFNAGGLAYDAVSKRFVIGNLPSRKLTIVEEGTNRAATLSGDAARLLNVRALEIDRRQGDLWVVSEGSRDGSGTNASELHKLQLVSGRVLTIYNAEDSDQAARFVDVAVDKSSDVLVLDASGPRILRPAKNGRLSTVMDLPKGDAISLAPTDDGRTVYVAYEDRIARADLVTRHVERVAEDEGALSGFGRLRWHKGSLVGALVSDGTQQIVQLTLSRNGRAVVSSRVLDSTEAPATSLASLDVLENDFFYLVPGEPQATIRRIRLK
jgi:hypothetical protein